MRDVCTFVNQNPLVTLGTVVLGKAGKGQQALGGGREERGGSLGGKLQGDLFYYSWRKVCFRCIQTTAKTTRGPFKQPDKENNSLIK